MDNTLLAYQQDFIELALDCHVLQFGEFELKSGRISPYFFNAGKFSTGSALARLGRCYAAALHDADLAFDMLFGPAYKGIPLVASTAMSLPTTTVMTCRLRSIAKRPKPMVRVAVLLVPPCPETSSWSTM